MNKLFIYLLTILFFSVWFLNPAYSESGDCNISEGGVCKETECRLEDGEIGVCRPTSNGCACMPNN